MKHLLQSFLWLSLLAISLSGASKPHYRVVSFEVAGYASPDIRDINEDGDFVATQREGQNTWPFFWKRNSNGTYSHTKINLPSAGYGGIYSVESDLFINDNEEVAGTYIDSSIRPFSWNAASGFQDYSGFSAVNGVYTRGLTEGGRLIGAELYDSSFHSWDFGQSSFQLLGPAGYRLLYPKLNVSNDSFVLGQLRQNTDYTNSYPAVINVSNGASISMGGQFANPTLAYPTDLNTNFSFVGYNLNGGNKDAWFLDSLTATPTMISAPAGESNTELFKLNSNDVAVGHADDRPIVWNLDGLQQTKELKTSYDDPSQPGVWASMMSGVTDINSSDQIVGYTSLPEGYDFGTLWDDGNPYDLNEISSVGFDRVIVEATKITDSGYVLVKGFSDGKYVSFVLEPVTDADGDMVGDYWEWEYGHVLSSSNSSDALLDLDSDGLTNLEEYRLGTDPTKADTDGDIMTDGFEVSNFLDPLNSNDAYSDFDNDGLSAFWEYIAQEFWGMSLSFLPEFESPVDMGPYAGYNLDPRDMNNDGEVVGVFNDSVSGQTSGFYWSESTGTIIALDDGSKLSPSADYISEDGLIAGTATNEYQWYDDDDEEYIPGTHDVALAWSSPLSAAQIVPRPIAQGHEYKDAGHRSVGFSDAGEVLLEVDKRAGTPYDRAYFTWSEDFGASNYLNFFDLNGHRIAANGGLDSFMTTPFRRLSSWADDFRAFEFLYRPYGKPQQTVDAFAEIAVRNSFEVYSANLKGQAVGSADGRPFVFDQGALSHLSVESPTQYGKANAINEYGAIVGESESPDGYVAATLWYPGSPAIELNYVIPETSGWDLVAATAINESGSIVGYGIKQGEEHQYRGFLLKAISQDDDGDGLSNDWEAFWARMLGYPDGTDIVFAHDSDGDKLSNYLEYLLGTMLTVSELDGAPVITDTSSTTPASDLIIVVGNQVMEVQEAPQMSRLRQHYYR